MDPYIQFQVLKVALYVVGAMCDSITLYSPYAWKKKEVQFPLFSTICMLLL